MGYARGEWRCCLHFASSLCVATCIANEAQHIARFDSYNIRNCLPPKKLRREIQ